MVEGKSSLVLFDILVEQLLAGKSVFDDDSLFVTDFVPHQYFSLGQLANQLVVFQLGSELAVDSTFFVSHLYSLTN